jgi:exosortase E/protease (VPEID-CTERM system)
MAVSVPKHRLSLAARLAVLASLFIVEKWLLDGFVDSERAQAAEGLGAFVRLLQHWGFRFLVTFCATVVIFAYVRSAHGLKLAAASIRVVPVRLGWALAHIVLIVALMPLGHLLYGDSTTPASFLLVLSLWLAVGLGAGLAGFVTFAPLPLWVGAARALGIIWLYAVLAALLGTGVWQWSDKLWVPSAGLTFDLVRLVLYPLLPTLSADTATRVLATDQFEVEVTDVCSGLEGMGLILAFSVAWLVYFRREYVFPRALLLIPVGLAAMFALNVLRIAALMLIGNAGYPDVAAFGFHSQAGWIAFNTVACGLVFVSRRSAWLNRVAQAPRASATDNPTAAYLMPLLAILAAGALSHAMSGNFETFYPLRLIAGAAMLWPYRHKLATLDWRFSWRGPAVGMLIFLLWTAVAHVLGSGGEPMPEKLAAMSPAMRSLWIISRIAASVLTVPLAEELAYRGYLMRRLTSRDFESVPYRSVGWPAILVTAVVFGLAHGALWLPGIAAGVAYGFLVVRRGTIGEAVAAHVTTNALVAATVLLWDQWQLW